MGIANMLRVFTLFAVVVAALTVNEKQERRSSACSCSTDLDKLSPKYVCTKTFSPVTYPGLGTFTADLPCHRRGFPPKRPEDIGTKFNLFTRLNPSSPEQLTDGGADSRFDPARPTKLIIHGFKSSGQSAWVQEMKDELLTKDNFNVIVVDWKKGAAPGPVLFPDYCKARQNLRVVARQIANLLKRFEAQYYYFDYEKLHIIGHSLGGQTGGYVGQEMGGKIGRISGMDPAEPDFQGDELDCRLDPSDANFVDVIHTSMFGLFQPAGHVDIYANYGTHMPGCPWWPSLLEGSCGHKRAHRYYIDTIQDDNCASLAYPCTWEKGQGQGCSYRAKPGVSTVKMGYQAIATPRSDYGSYIIMTNKERPFCAPDIVPEYVIGVYTAT